MQVEGEIVTTDIQFRPRRQLVCLIADPARRGAQLMLRFFTFYPSQQKVLAPGHRVRVFGDVREGHLGLEMVHPQFKVVTEDTPLSDRLTPVYPTTAGLGQETLRKVVARTLASDPALTAEIAAGAADLAPQALEVQRRGALPAHAAAAIERADAGGARRAHAPGVDAAQIRRIAGAAAVAEGASAGALAAARAGADRHWRADEGAARARAVQADARAGARVARDRARPEARLADAAAVAGRRRVGQDDRRRAGGAAGHRIRQAGRVHGADGDPGRAALPQAGVVARGLPVRIAWLSGRCRRRNATRRLRRWPAATRSSRSARTRCSRKAWSIPKLGLAIIDEQHRFGVAQRLALRGKGLAEAHQLMMSATPIPRTLAMTFYADLDVSALDELPPGRTPVATRLVSQKRRGEIVTWVGKACGGRPTGVLGVPADRGVREARTADRGRAARGADGGASNFRGPSRTSA